ncbi:MAG: ORC1-type DNA replication protein [Candidatus Baldrarchaeia archaeon]
MSGEKPLDRIFEQFLAAPKIFKNRDVLRPTYVPDELPHREKQITKVGMILASALRGGTPSNIFLYGKTGTGKTVVAQYVLKHLKEKCMEFSVPVPITSYINCRIVDTSYRVLAHLCSDVGTSVPITGLPTDTVYDKFRRSLDEKGQLMIIVLDEIDQLVRKNRESANDVLYDLTRINSSLENSKVSIIGISNDLKFKDHLDPRVISSLSEEEVVFPPYTADELKDILIQRAKIGFNEGVLEYGVINLCAALAAREHGDARRALDLLRVAGEIAEREGSNKVTEEHVRLAQREIEKDTVSEVLETLPVQSKLVLFSIYLLEKHRASEINTGDVYAVYQDLCRHLRIDSLTQRRVSDIINELDMLGLVYARVISRGRYGRTKRIKIGVSLNLIGDILEKDPRIKGVSNYVPRITQ